MVTTLAGFAATAFVISPMVDAAPSLTQRVISEAVQPSDLQAQTELLAETKPVNPLTLQYLNRLSDYLFILARTLNRRAGCGDVLWQKGKNR